MPPLASANGSRATRCDGYLAASAVNPSVEGVLCADAATPAILLEMASPAVALRELSYAEAALELKK
jgi:hypothetical protein